MQVNVCMSQGVSAVTAMPCSACHGFSIMQVEDCLESPNALASLTSLYQANLQQLSELSDLVGEHLTAVERCIMIALITIDVHNR